MAFKEPFVFGKPAIRKQMTKLIGAESVSDLLLFLPTKYTESSLWAGPLDDIAVAHGADRKVILEVEVISYSFKGRSFHAFSAKNPFYILCKTKLQEELNLVFFAGKRQIWERMFCLGKHYFVSGVVTSGRRNTVCSIVHPSIVDTPPGQSHESPTPGNDPAPLDAAPLPSFMNIEPNYSLVTGVKQFHIRAAVRENLPVLDLVEDWNFIPDTLPSIKDAFRALHVPQNYEETEKARLRVAFDELLASHIAQYIARLRCENLVSPVMKTKRRLVKEGLQHIPFQLTDDQKSALEDIIADQAEGVQTIRLVQGDVGSGKSVVMLLAALNAIEAGYQVAVMAPTSILALQLFSGFKEICDKIGVSIAFLSGKSKGRAKVLAALSDGVVKLIVGTNALCSADVKFKNLAFIAIDEQHRFGVRGRVALIQKGGIADTGEGEQESLFGDLSAQKKCGIGEGDILAHSATTSSDELGVKTLLVSATPIPRTLSMAIYGGMRTSVIKSKPSFQKPVITSCMNVGRVDELVRRVKAMVDAGGQVFWVCPAVYQEDGGVLMSVEERAEYLRSFFDDGCVGAIHGKLPEKERDEVMGLFISGKIGVIVATTVIEVGVSVANATVIVVENCENFGLSTLHQLRGRVGRGHKQSYCILLYKKYSSSIAERLAVIRDSNDGFYIAEKDLESRGSGELLGDAQSGIETFRAFRPYEDKEAVQLVQGFIASNDIDSIAKSEKTRRLLQFFAYDEYLGYVNK